MRIYELYSCDEWRSTDSMNVRSRIFVSDSLENMAEFLHEYVKKDKDMKKLYGKLACFDLLEKALEQGIDYLQIEEVEVNEEM